MRPIRYLIESNPKVLALQVKASLANDLHNKIKNYLENSLKVQASDSLLYEQTLTVFFDSPSKMQEIRFINKDIVIEDLSNLINVSLVNIIFTIKP